MTNQQLTLRSLDIPSIHKFAVGFDNVLDELMRINAQQANGTNYPPYNVLKHDEDHFSIELAVAGFRDGDITITVEKNILTIKSERTYSSEDDEPVTYLHQGIGYRNFSRTFTLAEHVEVVGASSENGILTIALERKVPDEQKPKLIAINYSK
jgi:molecular chaperone IbpA